MYQWARRYYLQAMGVRHDAVLGNGTKYADVARGSAQGKAVVCIANLHKEKSVDVLVSAFAHLDASWQLRVVGDGPERRALEEQAAALGVNDRVEFLGRLEREATLNVLDRGDLLALPSARESFGLAFLETTMRGIPAVGCFGTEAEEIIGDGVSGRLVPQGDPLAVADALDQMHNNHDAWGTAAREAALGKTAALQRGTTGDIGGYARRSRACNRARHCEALAASRQSPQQHSPRYNSQSK